MSATPATTLHTALLAAMRQMGPLTKNAQNPHLRNKYADLTAVFNTIEQPLWDNGLFVTQRFTHDQGGAILITEIVHAESGTTLASQLPIVCKDPTDPQKFGGAITYARRYALLSILALTAEDDDGNAAAKPAPRPAPTAAAPASGTMRIVDSPADLAAKPASGTRIAYNDPRHTTEYAPAQAARAEVVARKAEAAPADEHPLLATIRDDEATPKRRQNALHNYFMAATTLEELAPLRASVTDSGLPMDDIHRAYNWHNDRIVTGKAPAPKAQPYAGIAG